MSLNIRPLAIRSGEVLSYGAGIVLTGFFAVQLAQGEVERQGAISAFENQMLLASSAAPADPVAQEIGQASPPAAEGKFSIDEQPDTSLWAPGRIADYQKSLTADLPPILGVLEVPSVDLAVPVYQTASELVMDRAAGVIDGMAYPHEGGNIGISGHRDGYFRALKDVKVGDQIVLQTLEGEKRFTIEATTVVEKTDTHLLKDTREQTVTLVTCYPFYFVGHAPQRFIVTASLDTTYVNQN
jgi:LPXTG-site transpeptidase (sortase) family protein